MLVEDTQLRAEVLRKQNDFGYLEQDIRTQHIEKLICDENALKVYGSLFVLYRFLSRRITSDMSLDIDTIRFWLVVNDDQQDNAMALNEITWLLRQNLRAKLGKTFVSNVEVMAREFFVENMKTRLCKSRHIYGSSSGIRLSSASSCVFFISSFGHFIQWVHCDEWIFIFPAMLDLLRKHFVAHFWFSSAPTAV